MKLTITFDSWEEFEAFRGGAPAVAKVQPEAPALTAYHEELHRIAQEVAQNTQESAQKPQESAQNTQESAQKPQETDQKLQESAQEPVKIETVRKALADLNKKTGKNLAKELIGQLGYSRLTDVPQERFPELLAKAEEVLNA